LLAKSIDKFNFDAGSNSYQIIGEGFEYRDMMAHGKVNRIEYSEVENFNGFNFDTPWDCMGNLSFVEKLRDGIKSLRQDLVVA
jgi:hypothetical protein